MSTNIFPCPWCGTFDLVLQTSTRDREGTPCHMMCEECGAGGPWMYVTSEDPGMQEAEAVASWDSQSPHRAGRQG